MRSCRVVRICFTWNHHEFRRYSSLLLGQDEVSTRRASVTFLADEDRAVSSRFSRGHRVRGYKWGLIFSTSWHLLTSIFPKIITVLTRYRPIVLELI